MRISLDIPDADVPALAVQLGNRFTERADGATDAAHVTSAVQAWASGELKAARTLALAAKVALLEAAEAATLADVDATAAERAAATKAKEDAALAEYRARRA